MSAATACKVDPFAELDGAAMMSFQPPMGGDKPKPEVPKPENAKSKVKPAEWEGLGQMRSAVTPMTKAQSEVVALAFCRYNLLLRGPANCGKRWIARRASELLILANGKNGGGGGGEVVEVMSKWFTVQSGGQLIIDEAALPVAVEQIRRATVMILEDVPSQPSAAATFFTHLDFICRVERCRVSKSTTKTHSQSPFGGLQIIATQNSIENSESTHQIVWSHTSSEPTFGLLCTSAAPRTASPHPELFVILFR